MTELDVSIDGFMRLHGLEAYAKRHPAPSTSTTTTTTTTLTPLPSIPPPPPHHPPQSPQPLSPPPTRQRAFWHCPLRAYYAHAWMRSQTTLFKPDLLLLFPSLVWLNQFNAELFPKRYWRLGPSCFPRGTGGGTELFPKRYWRWDRAVSQEVLAVGPSCFRRGTGGGTELFLNRYWRLGPSCFRRGTGGWDRAVSEEVLAVGPSCF